MGSPTSLQCRYQCHVFDTSTLTVRFQFGNDPVRNANIAAHGDEIFLASRNPNEMCVYDVNGKQRRNLRGDFGRVDHFALQRGRLFVVEKGEEDEDEEEV